MSSNLFGWRKASKCKKLVRALQCRLKLLKNRRASIVKLITEDVAHLLQLGLHQIAFRKVGQLIRDKTMVEAFDLIDHYCEFVITHLPYIRKHKDCPSDINEAISALIFSSARFGELPELRSIRKLFGQRYGPSFVATAVELLPGNLVSRQMKELAGKQTITDDAKYRMLDEILINCSYIRKGQLLLEFRPDDESQEVKMSSSGEAITHIGDVVQDLESGESVEFMEHQEDVTKMALIEYPSSKISLQLPKETIYLNDIHEFTPQHLEDQRVFIFTSLNPLLHLNDTLDLIEKLKLCQENDSSSKLVEGGTTERTEPDAMKIEYPGELDDQYVEECSRWNEIGDGEIDECKGREITLCVGKRHDRREDHRDSEVLIRPRRDTHPKLPDYDELVAIFTAMKRANLAAKEAKDVSINTMHVICTF